MTRRKVRIEDMPHLVRPGMPPAQRDLAVSQNFEHFSSQLRTVAKALNEEDEKLSDFEDAPAPENLITTFRRRKVRRRRHYDCILRFNEPDDPDRERISAAVVQLQYVNLSGTPVELDDDSNPVVHRKRIDMPERDDPNDKVKAVFKNLEKPRHWYVILRARWKTGGVWYGEWSPWTSPELPKDEVVQAGAGQVSNLVHKHPAAGVHVWKWDEPEDEDVNVDRYKVVVQKKTGPGTYVDVETSYTRAQRFRYVVPKADRGTQHRARVTVVDEDNNEGTTVDDVDRDDNETIPGTDIQPGTIDITPLASSIRPIAIAASLPSLPDSDYPAGSYVYLTSDFKLYKTNDGTSWSIAVSFNELGGVISAGQISAGTINGGHIVANAITAGHIQAGAVSASEIAANAITATHIHATAALVAKRMTTNAGGETNYIVIDGDTPSNRDQVQFWSSGSATVISAQAGGIKFGGGTNALLGFYGHAPAFRPTVNAGLGTSGSDFDGTARGKINEIVAALKSIGLFG